VSEAPVQHRRESTRPSRYNARGWVYCRHCQHYKHPDDFKRHPSRPGKLWSYCRDCVREIDRERYRRKTSTLAGAEEALEKRLARQHRQRKAERKERRSFVLHAIGLLRRRGFTKTEISRLADVSLTSVIEWEAKPERKITPAVAQRFEVLIRETAHLPFGEPVSRRRRPHPHYDEVYARVHEHVTAIPVRNAWKYGRRAA
jgi:hypothetical protein